MKHIGAFLIAAVLFSACGDSPTENGDGQAPQRESVLPRSSGQVGELLVVISDELWDGEVGDAVRALAAQPYVFLPQSEPQFTINRQNEEFFYKFYKEHRSVLWIDVRDQLDNQDPRLTMQENVYSRNQIVFKAFANNATAFKQVMEENGAVLIEQFHRKELERIGRKVRREANTQLTDSLKMALNLQMVIPREMMLVLDEPGFKWYRRIPSPVNVELDYGIFVYDLPYTSDSTFTASYMLAVRDSVLRQHVSGGEPGSYMTTETFYTPVFQAINRNDQYVAEHKGLWRMEGEFLGGPFVQHAGLDESSNRVIFTDAYVLAPHEEKREHMRYLEGLLHTAVIGQRN